VQTEVVGILRSAMRELEEAYAGIEQSGTVQGGVRQKLWDNRAFSRFPAELGAPMKAFLGAVYAHAGRLDPANLVELEEEFAVLQAGMLGAVVARCVGNTGGSKVACGGAVEVGHFCSEHVEQALLHRVVRIARGNEPLQNNRKCMTCNLKVKDLKCVECFYCSSTFHLDCVKTLAAERKSTGFEKIDRAKDVFFCIRCVHERTSEVQMVGAGMLEAEWFGFEGAAWLLPAGESLSRRRGFTGMKLEDTYGRLTAACASGMLGALWKLFEEDVTTPINTNRPVFGIRDTPGRVKMANGEMGRHGRAHARRPLFAPHPVDSDDSHGDEDSDYVEEDASSEENSSDEGAGGSSQTSEVGAASRRPPHRGMGMRRDIEKLKKQLKTFASRNVEMVVPVRAFS